MDNELILLQVWQIVNELSDQLAHNQKLANALKSQAGSLKDQASQATSGFALRRFNVDISKETFESETERLNAQIIIENQTLLHEHKQLSLLLKEYENMMRNIMEKFRNYSLASQQHELTLSRHYEALLAAEDAQKISSDIVANTSMSHSIRRLCRYLRGLLKTMAGENCDSFQTADSDYDELGFEVSDLEELSTLLETLYESSGGGYHNGQGREDWAFEREAEITRLEHENEELRRMLGIDEATMTARGITVDPDRVESGRNSTLLLNSRRPSSEQYVPRDYHWENNAQAGAGLLQRAMDLPSGMRVGPQARRTGIFGAGQQRGGLVGGAGRGVSLAINSPGIPSVWSNAPPVSMSTPSLWQLQGGSSGLDLNR